MRIALHITIILFLTVVTQIGGLVYCIALLVVKKNVKRKRQKRMVVFLGLYLVATYILVPFLAPVFGRERINESEIIKARSIFYPLANRNYVRPELNDVLAKIASEFENTNSGIRLVYLDANFPFIDNFPMLPHLSHNDGKKIDVSFVYKDKSGELTNKKPSVSGYGIYENPTKNEYDQISICKQNGSWHYDFPKYLTFGNINKELEFSNKATKALVNIIVKQKQVGKLFIEPHLKSRLSLRSVKVRFHGCQAVRHDDHIHFQIK